MSDTKPSAPDSPASESTSRYSRQERFAPLGVEGQRRLGASTALVVGCGALGSVAANTLVRAGVGKIRIVDRDFLELSNLQRQVLYTEQDVADGLPKAVAAANRLRQVNSGVAIESVVADVSHQNLPQLAAGADVIVDGADNFETRLLINDYAIREKTPWVYGGCLGAEGQVLPVLPGETCCIAPLLPEAPPPGVMPTCDAAGVLGPAVNLVASIQALEAIKILAGAREAVRRKLLVVDLWTNRLREIDVAKLHESVRCPACDDGDFPWLDGRRGSDAAVLCGRNAVQVRPGEPTRVDLATLADRLTPLGEVTSNPFLVRLKVAGLEITAFADGRAIVGGTEDLSEARSACARYLGS